MKRLAAVMRRELSVFLAGVLVAGVACGPAAPPPKPAAPPPPVEPEPDLDEDEPEDEPEDEAEPEDEPPPEDTGPKSSGRPPVVVMGKTKVAGTFGETPAAKMELGGLTGAVLRIPEYTLSSGVNVTFSEDGKGKKTKGAQGKVYSLQGQVPPSEDFKLISAKGAPFELKLPLAGSSEVNLAIGEVDASATKVQWKVIAPKNVDEGAKAAFFELKEFTNAYVHLTTQPPTE